MLDYAKVILLIINFLRMKSLLTKILRHAFVQSFIALIISSYIRLVFVTGNWTFKNAHVIDTYVKQGKPFIASFWHGDLLMVACIWQQKMPAYVLISNHRDGKIISKTMRHFDINTIVGSTNKQGFEAARQILQALKKNSMVAITPDGPRGPREQVSDGILQMAKLAQVDIVPIAYSCKPMKRLRTWDQFRIARPFCKGVFVIGKPIQPSKDIEKLRHDLQHAMDDVVKEADVAI